MAGKSRNRAWSLRQQGAKYVASFFLVSPLLPLLVPAASLARFLFLQHSLETLQHLKISPSSFSSTMPLLQPGQEDHPDFSAHPDYQLIFHTLLATGQGREQVTAMLADLWRANRNALQVDQQPQAPQPPPPQQEPAEQHEPQQPDQAQPPNPQPHQQPRPDPEEHPEIHPRDIYQGPAPPPFPDRAPHAPSTCHPFPATTLIHSSPTLLASVSHSCHPLTLMPKASPCRSSIQLPTRSKSFANSSMYLCGISRNRAARPPTRKKCPMRTSGTSQGPVTTA